MLAAIALGSNLPSRFGSPEETLHEAVRRLGGLGRVTAVSSFHRTAPVGYLDQPDFLNAAALLETDLSPVDLLRGLLDLEHAMGRDRASAALKGPRTIDLDLLLYQSPQGTESDASSLTLEDPELTLPHPAMHERRFVLAPLAEIAPHLQHPALGLTVEQLLHRLGQTL